MEQNLTFHRVGFSKPLFSKPFGFFIFTDRTISLLSINSIKWMTTFTGCFRAVYSRNRVAVFKRVLRLRHQAEVFYFNAMSVFTNMVYNHFFWDCPIVEEVRNPMRSTILLSKVKKPISILIKGSVPKPTFPNLIPLLVKSLSFLFGVVFHIVQYTPYRKGVKYA